jgi:hypothetical protein
MKNLKGMKRLNAPKPTAPSAQPPLRWDQAIVAGYIYDLVRRPA